MLAGLTGAKELALNSDEAKDLSKALVELQEVHGWTVPDPKQAALTNLLMLAAMVYGTRAFAIYMRLKSEKEAKPAQTKPAAFVNHGEFT